MSTTEEQLSRPIILKKVFPFGTFYYLEDCVISEIGEGQNFSWEMGDLVIKLGEEFYGENSRVHYISNRINSYSIIPMDWLKFYAHKKRFKSFSVVVYGERGAINLTIEKLFYRDKINTFGSLKEALQWVDNFENNQ